MLILHFLMTQMFRAPLILHFAPDVPLAPLLPALPDDPVNPLNLHFRMFPFNTCQSAPALPDDPDVPLALITRSCTTRQSVAVKSTRIALP
jgi:hypothetical protein